MASVAERLETVLDKVRKLINLAASPNLKEAERAAYKACALIREAGLDVCDPTEIDAIYKELATAQNTVRQLETHRSAPDDADDWLRASGIFTGGFHTGGFQTANPPPPRTTAPRFTSSPTSTQPPMTHPVTISSSLFAGKCKFCQKPYQKGDRILWMKNVGSWCPTTDCYNNWKAAQAFNP